MLYKKLHIALFISLAFLISCQIYPSYEQIIERRSKIKPETFSKKKWFDDKGFGVEAFWEERPKLARDLINRNLLIGKNFDEIIELLGEQQKDEENNLVTYSIYVEIEQLILFL